MSEAVELEAAGRLVRITNPGKVFFPECGLTKLDLVNYYRAVAPAAVRAVAHRPMALKRFPDGAAGKNFFQKHAPESRPEWVEVATVTFPSGNTADEVVVSDEAQLLWVINLGCIDLNPHAVRTADLLHPDELRIDLDPNPDVSFAQVCEVALVCREVLRAHGLDGVPKTSGSRGVHVTVAIEPRWSFGEVRRAAIALAREAERAAPGRCTSAWWKEERQGVFIDYNQNAQDRTVASAYSVRPRPDARVSTPLAWDEVKDCDPAAFTVATVPTRLREVGDLCDTGRAPGSLEKLLETVKRHEGEGLGDAPWPPHYRKQAGEPSRVAPSKRRKKPSAP